MSCPQSTHLLFLGGLLQIGFLLCVAKEYYVTPTQKSNFTCPTGKPCHTLDDYATSSYWLFKDQDEVSLLFGSGTHDFTVDWNMSNVVTLTLIGLSSSNIVPNITCNNCRFEFSNITTLKMEYLSLTNEEEGDVFVFLMEDVQNIIQKHILTWKCFHYIFRHSLPFNYDLHDSVHRQLTFIMSTNSIMGSLLFQDSVFTNGSSFIIIVDQSGLISLVFRNIFYYSNLESWTDSGSQLQSLNNITIDNCHFEGNKGTPSFLQIGNSNVYLNGNTTFASNIGVQGGAMNLLSSYLYLENDSNVTFINNNVIDVGGAIYSDDGPCFNICSDKKCFYQLSNGANRSTTVFFVNNTAEKGGNNVYGTSFKSSCQVNDNVQSYEIQNRVFHFTDKAGHDLSPVARKPERVCLCDEKGKPQCATYSYIIQHWALTPGEKFNLSVAVVGGDFGTVTGAVYATLNGTSNYFLGGEKISVHYISLPVCTTFEYSIYSSGNYLSLFIGIDSSQVIVDIPSLNSSINDNYENLHYIDDTLRVTPVNIFIDMQACPIGLTLNNSSYTCECSKILTNNGIDHCIVDKSKGFVYRNETTWIGLFKMNDSIEILLSHNCPFGYCKTDNISVNLNDPDFQCELGHVGILCGSCPPGLSLALGSSQCLNCTDDRGLALVFGFLAAGPALVFLIKILDLTVAWGTMNGLILYANIIWINRNILFLSKGIAFFTSFPPNFFSHSGPDNGSNGLMSDRYNSALAVFKVFIAWLNLDFGIESCFFQGLNAYWKTWLQFVFPLYLWIIVLTIIVLCHYSSKLTRVFGNNVVGVLATLFLMSYIKLLRTIVTVFGFAVLYSQDRPRYVWLSDGSIPYFGWPHSVLFVTGLLVLIFLILPYTLTLLCVPYLKRKSDWYLLSWINKFKPVFDVYYAPLKDKYHYWIGVTLLIRVVLALLNDTSQSIPFNISLAVTASISAVMSMLVTYVYNSNLSALEGFFLMNLTILCVSFLTSSTVESKTILVCASIGVSFLTFLGILVFHVYTKIKKYRKGNSQDDYQRLDGQREQQVATMTTVTYGTCSTTSLSCDGLRESLL